MLKERRAVVAFVGSSSWIATGESEAMARMIVAFGCLGCGNLTFWDVGME